MFNERKTAMMAEKNHFVSGDDNSKFYNKPDEAPISHPAEVLERLKKEKPDTPMEELVKEADEIVSQEMKDRQKQREEAAASTEATIEESNEEGERSFSVSRMANTILTCPPFRSLFLQLPSFATFSSQGTVPL